MVPSVYSENGENKEAQLAPTPSESSKQNTVIIHWKCKFNLTHAVYG